MQKCMCFFVLLIETLYESSMLGRYCFLRSFINWDVKYYISCISTNNSDKFLFRGNLFIDSKNSNIGLNIIVTKRLDNLKVS